MASRMSIILAALGLSVSSALAQEAGTLSSKAYIVAEIEVRDASVYEGYKSAVAPMVAKYGGRYIVRGGTVETIDGQAPVGRVIILEFPSLSAAQTFLRSNEYQPVAEIRRKSAKSRLFVVEGLPE